MKKQLIAFATSIALGALKYGAQALWDSTWALLLQAIKDAESKWGNGTGLIKKEEVIKRVMEFVQGHKRLGWIKRVMVKVFLGRIIDDLVDILNSRVGPSWTDEVADLRDKLAKRIPYIQ